MTRLEITYGKRSVRTTTLLRAGVHALVGSSPVAADALLRAIAGARSERHVAVLVDGAPPFGNPGVRRDVGALFLREEAPEADSVEAFLREVLALRGGRLGPGEILEAAGLTRMLARSPASLSGGEQRALALAVALAAERPRVLALFEPLSAGVERRLVVERLSAHAASGAVVVCRTSSAIDAQDLGVTGVVALENGRLWRASAELLPWFSAACFVRSDAPEALRTALVDDAAVTSAELGGEGASGELAVVGPDSEATVLAVLRAAARSGAVLHSMRRAPDPRPSAPSGAEAEAK